MSRDPLDSHLRVLREGAEQALCVSFQLVTGRLQALDSGSAVSQEDDVGRLVFHCADEPGSFMESSEFGDRGFNPRPSHT